ncbi:MAG: hypothetical protein ACT4PT_04630 [Methanobacteriota archaeon]
MKIDIGNGKILGTKVVSQNGQVSGFSEFKGREVLVILPEGEPTVVLDAKDFGREVKLATQEHMRLAFKQYEVLSEKYGSPEEAAKKFLDTYTPKSFQGLFEKADAWVKDELAAGRQKFEEGRRRVAKVVRREPATPPEGSV